jgi:hypothetical protein
MSAAMSEFPDDGADLVGSYRRFGEIGPVYEVVSITGPGKVRICLVESGEMVDYPVAEVRKDPRP